MGAEIAFVRIRAVRAPDRGAEGDALTWAARIVAAAFWLAASTSPTLSDVAAPDEAKSSSYRIALLGTSLTKNGGWDGALAERLSECLGRPVEALNFGGAGKTSRWGLGQVDKVLLAKPDLVAIEFSANDASFLKGFSIAESVRNVEAIARRLAAAERPPQVILLAMNPMHGLRGWARPWLDRYYDAYEGAADRLGAGYLDLRPHWRALGASQMRAAIPDGVHPRREIASNLVDGPLAAEIADRFDRFRQVDGRSLARRNPARCTEPTR